MSVLMLLIAAWCAGGPLAARPAGGGSLAEAMCFRLLAGLAVTAPVLLALACHSLFVAQYALAAAAAGGVGWSLWGRKPGPVPNHLGARAAWRGLNRLEKCSLLALSAAGLLTLISALAPSTGWDAAVAHLALPAAYARAGRIALDPGNVYTGYPQFLHVLYAIAYSGSTGGELLVSMLNWGSGLLACGALYALGRRAGTRQTGLVAAAMLATAPIYMDQAGSVGIDLGFAAYSTAALAALMAWRAEGRLRYLALAGLFAGAGCGIRHTGLLVAALMLAAVPALAWRRRPVRALALFGGCALAAAAPWLARSWIVTGNPVFPFLLAYFPAAPIDHIAISDPGAHESIARAGGAGLLAYLRFPWDIVMRPQLFDGWNKSPGGLVLALGIPGLFLGGARAWGLGAFSVAGGTVFFFFQRLARYLLPFFTPMMVVAALAVERFRVGRRAVAAVVLISFAYGLGLHAAAMHFKVKVVLGLESRASYLDARVERYAAFEYANAHLNTGEKLLLLDQRSYYFNGPSFQNHWSLRRIAGRPLREQVAWLREQGIRYVMIPDAYVSESGALSGEIAEMLSRWRRSPRWFDAVGPPMTIPQRGGGLETVVFLAVREPARNVD